MANAISIRIKIEKPDQKSGLAFDLQINVAERTSGGVQKLPNGTARSQSGHVNDSVQGRVVARRVTKAR